MLDSDILQLRHIRASLRNELALKDKLRANSAFISLLYLSTNECLKVLTKSAVGKADISRTAFDRLLTDGLIRMTKSPDRYALTAKGLWTTELAEGVVDLDLLVKNLDEKLFDVVREDVGLSDKEKVIILSMIAVRSFSPESALDLGKGDIVYGQLEDLFVATYELLNRQGVVLKMNRQRLFGGTGNEHPVRNLLQHTDALPKKTSSIYQALGRRKYCLELARNGDVFTDGLEMLFGFIFEGKMTEAIKSDVNRFCRESASSRSVYLFDLSKHKFANPVYEGTISEALEGYFATQYRWAREPKVKSVGRSF